MPRSDDQAYYVRRTAEERQRGDQSSSAIVAAIHYELANRYAILAACSSTGIPNLTIVGCGREQLAA